MKDIEQFLEQHADADGNVSDADMAKLITGGHQGDTSAGQPTESGVPAAGSSANEPTAPAAGAPAPQPDPEKKPDGDDSAAAAPAAGVEPVILARDGVHTISYQKLVEARDAERLAKAEAQELREKLAQAAKAAPAPAPAAPAPAPAAAAGDTGSIFGDYSDASIKAGLEKLMAEASGKTKAEIEAELAPLKQHQADLAAAEHFRAITEKHPDMGSIVESTEFSRWVDAQPSIVREAYKHVLERGTAHQVVEMLDSYKAAHPAKNAAAPAVDVNKRVEEVIAAAKTKVPASLSDIPAATAAHHDEAEAMAEASPMSLLSKFQGKSPAEIEALVKRLV
eukprot:gene8601-10190_t